MSHKGLILIPFSCEINLTQEAPLQWNIFGCHLWTETLHRLPVGSHTDKVREVTLKKCTLKGDRSNLWLVTSQRPGFVSCKLHIYKKPLEISIVKSCPYGKIFAPYWFSKLEIMAIQFHWEHTVQHLIVNLNITRVGEISTSLSLV